MNTIIYNIKKTLVIMALAIFATFKVQAQVNDPGGPGTNGSTKQATGANIIVAPSTQGAAPIDGGASLLVLATAAFAGKKLSRNKKK
jgi:hypothetical protein